MSDDEVYDLADRGDDRPGLEDVDLEDVEAVDADFDHEDVVDVDELDDLDDDSDADDESDVDDDEDDDLDDDADEFDDLEDASPDDVDFVVALYREDGTPVGQALAVDLANDFDDLVTQLQRLPGDAGALGLVSIAGEFFVAVRVRGQHVQVVLSDVYAAENWNLARDVLDYLSIDVPDDDDEDGLVGDLEMLADLGLSEMELDVLCADLDEDSDVTALRVADHIHFGPQARKAADTF